MLETRARPRACAHTHTHRERERERERERGRELLLSCTLCMARMLYRGAHSCMMASSTTSPYRSIRWDLQVRDGRRGGGGQVDGPFQLAQAIQRALQIYGFEVAGVSPAACHTYA